MKTEILIIGAGISGTSIAYNLAKEGITDIVVVEKGFLTSGSTGRCGAGVRQQWGTKANCIMAKHSIEFFENAEKTLDYDGDIEFKQEGYLILAVTPEEDKAFSENVVLQNDLGIPSVKCNKEEALKIVPHLNPESFISATSCQTDGHLNPFKMTDAFYQKAHKMGVNFLFSEEVESIIKTQDGFLVKTNKREIEAEKVVNAAGGYSHEIGMMVDLDIPTHSEKHEILVTEPVERMQGPMVMSFAKNIYCQQVPHGSFLIGRGDPKQKPSHDMDSSWEFLDEMSKTVMEIMPKVGKLRVVRQWAGLYNLSPDRQPIISAVPEIPGFFVACGFSGHGFMFAPITGLMMTQIITGKETMLDRADYDLHRFKINKTTVKEKSVV